MNERDYLLQNIVKSGEKTKHIHMISFEYRNSRLELIYSNTEITTATLYNSKGTTPVKGILSEQERQDILPLIKRIVGEQDDIYY